MVKLYIHGSWYEIDSKQWQHPGGPVALHLGEGRDATALFELHHPFVSRKRLCALLNRFRIEDSEAHQIAFDDPREQISDFEWGNNPLMNVGSFRLDMIESMRSYFESEAVERGVSFNQSYKMPQRFALTLIAKLILLVCIVPFWTRGHWWSLPVLTILIWILTATLLHDGSHFAVSANWRINQLCTHAAPWLASSSSWYIQHVIGHHAHTNIPMRDPDMYHALEIWRYVPSVDWIPVYSKQWLLWPYMWMAATFSTAFQNELKNSSLYNGVVVTKNRRTHIYFIFMALRAFILIAVFGVPCWYMPLGKGLVFSILPYLMLSVLFMTFSQVSHLDETAVSSRHHDFWRHQLVSTIDYSNTSPFWSLISNGLNAQSIHHCFPTIHPAHYAAIFPIFQEVCKRHNSQYRIQPSLWHAFCAYFHNLHRMSFQHPTKTPPNNLLTAPQRALKALVGSLTFLTPQEKLVHTDSVNSEKSLRVTTKNE